MQIDPRHKLLDRVFEISVVLKGIFGALEVVGGVALLFISPEQIRGWISWVSGHFVVGHEHSPVWRWFSHLADRLDTDATFFAAAYLVLHGVIKVVLVWAVLREKLWAYPWMIVALLAFIAYQCYEMAVHFTWTMLALTLFDIFIIALTLREWQLHRQRLAAASAALTP